ncbi:MAG: tRNA (adenosine(37)-N6)-dimethylallyltransferase MiaA [Parvularculaceae bacterium]
MNESRKATVAFIAGPTASGKSAAALALAEEFGGEIVNADAMQVYRDLRILTARPSKEEDTRIPHHLFGWLDGAERCSAGRWARAAADVIAGRRRPTFVVGGTGLYFRALEDGLSPIPQTPDAVRAAARARLEALGPEAFQREVVSRDPDMARLNIGDVQRLLRAWEVHEATGRPLSAFQAEPRTPLIAPPVARVVIEPPREALYAACEARFDRMMEEGALEEARTLATRGLDHGLPVMKALGAAELMAHLRGEMTIEEAVDRARRNTRRFAKRQRTWFRGQAPDWPRAIDADEAIILLKKALAQ